MLIAEHNYQDVNLHDTSQEIWLNPVGGMGDILIASSVLKIITDQYPDKKFNIIRRSRFMSFFNNHPAVNKIGHPPSDAIVVSTLYWKYNDNNKIEAGPGINRPFQLLAKKFGLKIPVEEIFYYPNEIENDLLFDFIPWKSKNILIAPMSDSQKKNMNPMGWIQIVEKIKGDDRLIVQVGVDSNPYIIGTFNLIGLTSPAQVINILKKCDLLITVDNFIMHLAHMTKTRTIVLWGPTQFDVFGYPEHIHFTPQRKCEFFDRCMGRKGYKEFNEYHKPCHLPAENHCMNYIDIDNLVDNIEKEIHIRN
ncbi:MAG: glycosyltransferase family 9 protein [Candidatus Thorarchaeota archaeon]